MQRTSAPHTILASGNGVRVLPLLLLLALPSGCARGALALGDSDGTLAAAVDAGDGGRHTFELPVELIDLQLGGYRAVIEQKASDHQP